MFSGPIAKMRARRSAEFQTQDSQVTENISLENNHSIENDLPRPVDIECNSKQSIGRASSINSPYASPKASSTPHKKGQPPINTILGNMSPSLLNKPRLVCHP